MQLVGFGPYSDLRSTHRSGLLVQPDHWSGSVGDTQCDPFRSDLCLLKNSLFDNIAGVFCDSVCSPGSPSWWSFFFSNANPNRSVLGWAKIKLAWAKLALQHLIVEPGPATRTPFYDSAWSWAQYRVQFGLDHSEIGHMTELIWTSNVCW